MHTLCTMESEDIQKDGWNSLMRQNKGPEGDQTGSNVYPSEFTIGKMRECLQIATLNFGGERHGYFFWCNAEGGKMRVAMRDLLSTFEDYDKEVGKLFEANRRIKELEEKLANYQQDELERVSFCPPEEVASTHVEKEPTMGVSPVVPLSTAFQTSNKKLTGAECYNMKATGKAWVDIGGSPAMRRARSYANHHGKPWPVTAKKPATQES